jgi:hypothetical protein
VDYLFSEADMYDVIENLKQRAKQDVDSLDEDSVLNTSSTDLVEHFVTKYQLDVPVLHEDGIYVESRGEASIDVSGDPFRDTRTLRSPPYLRGSQVTIAVPFSGEPELFRYRPNQYTTNPPRATVTTDELHLTYTGIQLSSEQVKGQYTADVGAISQWLAWMRSQAEPYNAELEAIVRTALDQRRQKILSDRNMVESLGLPIKKTAWRGGDVQDSRRPAEGEDHQAEAASNARAVQG